MLIEHKFIILVRAVELYGFAEPLLLPEYGDAAPDRDMREDEVEADEELLYGCGT